MSVRFQRRDTILYSGIDEDVVALSVEDGLCFGLPAVTATVWRLLEHPRDVDELEQALMDIYAVDADTCSRELAELLEDMEAKRLIVRSAT